MDFLVNLPPESWALIGVVVTAGGGLVGTIVAAWAQGGAARVAEAKELRTELRLLRTELTEAHREMHEAKAEAYAIKDTAKLQVAMSAAYIYQLQAHINTEQGPPAPPIPAELAPLLTNITQPPADSAGG